MMSHAGSINIQTMNLPSSKATTYNIRIGPVSLDGSKSFFLLMTPLTGSTGIHFCSDREYTSAQNTGG